MRSANLLVGDVMGLSNGALGKCDVSVDDGLQIDDADEGTALAVC
jgi:hypothetical protein